MKYALLLPALLVPALSAQVPDSSRRDSAVAVAPITITVTRRSEPLTRSPQAVGVLDSTALRRGRPQLGLSEALNDLPGTFVADRGNYSLDQRISIRGFGSRSAFGTRGVMVLLDGIPQTLPDGQSQLTNVDLGEISRVEVLRGSASALYGNGAGGVVSLTSAAAAAEPTAARLRILGGAAGLFKWQGWGSARHGPWSGTIALSRAMLDGFRQQSAADLRQLALNGEYLGAATRLAIHFDAADDPKAQNPGALTTAEYAANPDSAAANNLTRNADKAVTQQQLSLQYTRYGTDGDRYDLTLFGVLRDLKNPLASNTFVRIIRRAGGVRVGTLHRLGAAPDAPQLTAGVDAQWLRDDRTNTTPAHGPPTATTLSQLEYVSEIGPFARMTWSAAPRWQVEGGVRYDAVHFEVDDRYLADSVDNSGTRTMASWSGSAGLTWDAAPGVAIYSSVSTSYETPTTTELAIQQGGAGGFNDSLGPQRAVTEELGARGTTGTLTWSAAFFEAQISNAIVPYLQSSGRSYYTNAGQVHNGGIEAGVTWHATHAWSFSGAWTWAHYRFADYTLVTGATSTSLTGKTLAGVPDSYLRLGLRREGRRVWIALDQTVTSRLFADDANAIGVNGWTTTDLRAGADCTAGSTRFAPFVGINNLWNARYVGSVTINGAFGRVLEPAAGRNAYAGIEASW